VTDAPAGPRTVPCPTCGRPVPWDERSRRRIPGDEPAPRDGERETGDG